MNNRVDYDRIAARYETRYERNDYSGIEAAVLAFVRRDAAPASSRALEVGCGTGHWLRVLKSAGYEAAGIDPSDQMLNVARMRDRTTRLVRARAEALPCATASIERLFCVNALHHFSDPALFFRESRRVLRDGGGLLTIGLDPHAGSDQWWIYDYFPTALGHDRRRYLAAPAIRELMHASGFARCETREVQHLASRMTIREAERRGFLDRASSSQLMVITEQEFDAGIARLHAQAADTGRECMLCADLHIYGTVGWAS